MVTTGAVARRDGASGCEEQRWRADIDNHIGKSAKIIASFKL